MKKNTYIRIGILIVFVVFIKIKFVDSDTLKKRYSEQAIVTQVGLTGYLTEDLKETIENLIPEDKNYLTREINAFYGNHTVMPYVFEKKKRIKNVILIQLEGVDSVLLDAMKDGEYITPNLHQIKENGIWFPNVYDQTGSGRTSDGEFLTLTSLLPLEGQSMYTHYNLEHLPSLPKIMRESGRTTIALHGNDGEFWNRKTAHKALGYEEMHYAEDISDEVETGYTGWGYSDRTMLRETLEVLKKHEEPVFTHTILLTTHYPYDAVNTMGLDLPFKNTESTLESYLNCLYYTDQAMGEFVEQLSEEGILDESLLVIYADHDSGLTEDVYHYMGMSYDSGDLTCDKVPFIIYDGINSYIEDMPSGQANTMPLILSYLAMEIPDIVMGANYVKGDEVSYTHHCVIKKGEILPNTYDLDAITKLIVAGKLDKYK